MILSQKKTLFFQGNFDFITTDGIGMSFNLWENHHSKRILAELSMEDGVEGSKNLKASNMAMHGDIFLFSPCYTQNIHMSRTWVKIVYAEARVSTTVIYIPN